MRNTDFELLNELYDQNVQEGLGPLAAGMAKDAARTAAVDSVTSGIRNATSDPRTLEASTEIDLDEPNDTSDELGDTIKGHNIEMISDLISKTINALMDKASDSSSPLGKQDCVDMIMAAANANLQRESGCASH